MLDLVDVELLRHVAEKIVLLKYKKLKF